MVRRVVALVFLVLAVGLAGPAAADSKIKGKVKGTGGEPVGEATVAIADATSGRGYTLKTKKDGSFYQRGVLPATYTVTVEAEGYTKHIVEEVRVQAGVEKELNVTLRSIAERQAELREERGLKEYGEGFEAFQKGDYETALARADEAIAKHPDDPKGYDMKAKALVGLKRYAEALPLLEKELAMPGAAPDAKEVLAGATYNAGVVASREEKNDEAIALWERAIELGYSDARLAGILGRAYLERQDFAGAARHLEAYLAKNAEAADAAEVRALLQEIQKLGAKP